MAIAFDSKTGMTTGSSSTPTSASHTAAVGDILWFGVSIRDTRTITAAPTWNGQTMTQSGSTAGTSGVTDTLYYLVVVTGGTAAVSCTQSVSDTWAVATISFTGAKTSGQPDATSIGGPTITTSYSQSVTSVADNCFAVMYGNANGGLTLGAGTNTTIANQPEIAFCGAFLAYSTTAKTPAGTFTLNVTSSSQGFSCCMASFAPASTSGASGFATINLVVSSM